MTNLNLYKLFYTVALEQNISKASEKLFVSQPAISSSIKELEKQLNKELFLRKNKGVELTDFGKVLFAQIEPIMKALCDVEELPQKYDDLQTGIIKIGCNTSNVNQILLSYLSEFVEKYPNIKIVMQRGTESFLYEQLSKNNLDIIFVDNNKQNKNFEIVKNFEIKYQLVGNSKFKSQYFENNINIKHFPTDCLIMPSKNNKSRTAIDEFFEKNHLKILPKYELDNYILLFDFVKKGYGIAFVNIDYYTNSINNKEVEIIYPDLFLIARQLVCLTNKKAQNPATNKLVEIITKQ